MQLFIMLYGAYLMAVLDALDFSIQENVVLPLSMDIVKQFSIPEIADSTIKSLQPVRDLDHVDEDVGLGIESRNTSFVGHSTTTNLKNYFAHLVWDEVTNSLYAGATNHIFHLSNDLKLLSQAVTGPKADSALCHASGCADDVDTTLMNNFNKILIVSNANGVGMLITCGSIRQGACEVYNLTNFPNNPRYIDLPLAANDEFASTYAFVGPAKYSWKKENILYVGTTFTNVGDYRHDVPAISSRRLNDLNYAEFEIKQSIINIDVKYRDHFLVDYIYGFNSSEYAYFILVQKKSHLADEAGYVTRLARVCISDSNYDSYTEITIECLATSRKIDYNILRDAKLTTAGQHLAQQMRIKKDDNIVIAIFSPSVEISNEPQNQSAMCIYSLKYIEDCFNENIHLCFNGTVKDRNLGYISGAIDDGRCPGTTGNVYSFCNVGLKISGVSPISANALFHFNVSITSITATNIGPHTLAFLGTSYGSIKKIITSRDNFGQYDEVLIDPGNKVLQDTMISKDKDFLYVLSKTKITKLNIQHCSSYSNCSECLQSRDPFCGWCSLEKRCTIRSTCEKDTSADRWISLGSGQQCIDFESIFPDKIPISKESKLKLIIRTLPEPLIGKYRCVFGNSTLIDAEVIVNGLSCNTPPLQQRPIIPPNEDHVLVPLAVRSSETNKDFVSRAFAFFDCSHHTICVSCVNSSWDCNWCIFDNKCIHKMEHCRNMEKSIIKHNECPQLSRINQPVLLPVRVPKEIRFEIENLPKPKNEHSGFLCSVQIEAAQMLLHAHIEYNRIVVCKKTAYFYEANINEYKIKINITWNRQYYIGTGEVILYKCEVLGSHRNHADCSLCVTRDSKYQCVWCKNICVFNETCAPITAEHEVFTKLPNNHPTLSNECPLPRIDMIKPIFGPVEGGTLVTIEGSNLGIKEEDVQGRILIGEVPCHLVSYEVSVKIECLTGMVSRELTTPVKIINNSGYTKSSVQFQFKNVQLIGLQPILGPKSGGTKISIIGKYLNIGSNIRAFLDEYECYINFSQISSSRLTCVTSEATKPQTIQTLRVLIDGANRTLMCNNAVTNVTSKTFNVHLITKERKYINRNPKQENCSIFNYTHDPTIMEIKPLQSFASGGRLLTVHGMHLNSVQNPELVVHFNNKRLNKTSCYVINSNQMECPSPAVNAQFQEYRTFIEHQLQKPFLNNNYYTRNVPSLNNFNRKSKRSSFEYINNNTNANIHNNGISYVQVHTVVTTDSKEAHLNLQLSFIMDNVKLVQDLTKHYPHVHSNIVYVSDPIYYNFPSGIKLYKGDALVIEGNRLNAASDESDIVVTIGTEICNVTSLTTTQLLCAPPKRQPSATDESGLFQKSKLPLVVVKVGKNLRFVIGHIKYDLIKLYSLTYIIWASILTISMVLVVLTIILIIYKRKSTNAEREYKRIQIQMITLESNVRSECKQAFAELQTDITDMTSDLEVTGIPSLNRVNYIMKVFFPGVTDHPILISSKIFINSELSNYDKAMLLFEELVNNKYFILTFIDILELQKTFNIRDKVNVASLLMIILMNKMEYATEILKSLLMKLVDKSLYNKNPHLMLRRTESVVEKMLTNYMAICMYDYLKSYAGSSLFLLFKAIKHQIEKGLVDAVTHDAKYSLSEDRLLHDQITYSTVILHIVQDDMDEKIQCKVLDWDTISQVKSKVLDALFKNTPFSMRPSITDVDLEWRHGRNGPLILQDEDMTTKTINGWKRLNTLAHYGVKESAVISLVERQVYNYQIGYNKQLLSYNNFYYINNSQSHMIIDNDTDCGLHQPRIFHIVKPNNNDGYMNLKNSFISANCETLSSNAIRSEGIHKTIPEVYLTRLLAAKGTIKKYVDDFFATILTISDELPPVVKWLFDLLDEAAKRHEIYDTDIIHAWKSNSLPLRFWVNFIKNPDFIFDINKTVSIDSSLSCIAQTFMDACSTNEHRIGKDSPSNKLLFAKDIPQYRRLVMKFYQDVACLPNISDYEMNVTMQQLSLQQNDAFDTIVALKELYIYVTKYYQQINAALENDINCKKFQLAQKLQNLRKVLEVEDSIDC